MTIDWQLELHLSIKLLTAFFLGGLIGFERETTGHEAGIRTFGLITLGSCVFGLVSGHLGWGDPGRIAAQVVSGIGFMGVGLIFREGGTIKGLTTAATLWCSSAIGLSIAFDMYVIGILTTVIIVSFLAANHLNLWKKISRKGRHNP